MYRSEYQFARHTPNSAPDRRQGPAQAIWRTCFDQTNPLRFGSQRIPRAPMATTVANRYWPALANRSRRTALEDQSIVGLPNLCAQPSLRQPYTMAHEAATGEHRGLTKPADPANASHSGSQHSPQRDLDCKAYFAGMGAPALTLMVA